MHQTLLAKNLSQDFSPKRVNFMNSSCIHFMQKILQKLEEPNLGQFCAL